MLDVIIFLVLAVFLINKLFGMLGKADEDSIQRSGSVIERMLQEMLAKQRMQFGAKNADSAANAKQEHDQEIQSKPVNAEIISVAEALLEPKAKETVKYLQNSENFNLEDFVNKAKKAFTIIINALTQGDVETLMHLLDEALFTHFAQKIDERKLKNYSVEHNIINIKSLDVMDASVIENTAYIQVRICSEQGFWVKNAEGRVIEGNEGKISVVYSNWKFCKKLGADNKTWLLTEAQEGKSGF